MLKRYQDITKSHVPKFDYHLHTSWTDGNNTSLEMYNSAVDAGLESILFSEHARKSSGDWFLDFAKEIRSLPRSSCEALVGVETKIVDFNGNIDSTDEILGECDLVLASVHRFPNEKLNKSIFKQSYKGNDADVVKIELDLSLAVLENNSVDILGHPFGMSIRRFGIYPSEMSFKKIIHKASKTGVAFEINPQYHSNLWELIEWCKEAGALISLGSNAHKISDVGRVYRELKKGG